MTTIRKQALRLRIFKLIEAIVYEKGYIKRSNLVALFDMSVPKASIWIQEYRDIYPDNLSYDFKITSWVKTHKFKLTISNKSSTKEYIEAALMYLNKTQESVFANDIKLEKL